MKLLILLLIGLHTMPIVITQLIVCSGRRRERDGGIKLAAVTALNLLGNGGCALLMLSWRFHTRTPWSKLLRMAGLNCSYQDVGTLAMTLAVCVAAGMLGGFVLRWLFFRNDIPGDSQGGRAVAWILAGVCIAVALAGRGAMRDGARQLKVEAVYRKMEASFFGGMQTGDVQLTGEVSCVAVRNEGPLDYDTAEIYLSETEDDLRAISFSKVRFAAEDTFYLVMNYDHGIDLKKSGGTTVYLSDAEGRVLDSLRVPALQEAESYARNADSGEWEILSYGTRIPEYQVEAPVFSAQGGMYDEAFELSISGPEGARIYYTLDCSDPDAGSNLYTGPILIEDGSAEEDIWSAQTNLSAAYLMGVRYQIPDDPVDKCTVVRAVCENEAGERSAVVTASYFIGYQNRTGYRNTRMVSIVTDPENLFDDEKGIYVLGDTFEKEYDADTETKGWWWWPANYHQRGMAWEREADIQMLETSGSLLLNKVVGMRIKGGASAGLMPKGMNLYARKSYDGVPSMEADLFGTGYDAKRISISAGGNDVETEARDWLMSRLAGNLDIPMYHLEPCSVFLEGEYWGMGWLTEKFDDVYFQYHAGIPKEYVAVIKNGSVKYGDTREKDAYQRVSEFIRKQDMSDPALYSQAGQMMDLENMIAYFALEIYCGNTDWSNNANVLLWRSVVPLGEGSADGRWRWALFDVNHPSVFQSAEEDTITRAQNKFGVFRSLMKNDEFHDSFYETLKHLAEETFHPDRTREALDEYRELMGEALNANHLRFYNTEFPEKKLDAYQQFFEERAAYILKICEKELE